MVAALAYIQQMRDAIAPKPRGFTAIGVLLFLGAVMATFAAMPYVRRILHPSYTFFENHFQFQLLCKLLGSSV
jgi:hypothetical protein